MKHFPDLSYMVVDLPCFSVVRSLTSWFAFLLLFCHRHASTSWHALTLYPSHFCHIYLCPVLSFNHSIVFSAFWLTSLFLQVSSLVTNIKDLRGNPGLPLPALLAKTFSCCVSYCLVEVVTMEESVQISIFIYQCSKRCKSTTYSYLESTHHCWIFQLLEVKPDSWLRWFP